MLKGLKLSDALQTSPMALLKMAELRGLGRFASTHCYNYPWALQLEVTNNCNLRCKTCPRLSELEQKGSSIRDMDFDTYKKILDGMPNLFWLFICGRGESLLNKDIFRMIEYAVGKGIPGVVLATNGTLLRGENCEKLIQANPRGVGISIDSPDSENFRKIRNLDLDKLLKDIKEFTSQAHEIPVGITSVLNSENIHNISDMPALCHQVGAEYFRILPLIEYDTEGVKSIRLDDMDQKFYDSLFNKLTKECEKYDIDLIMQKRFREKLCSHPFNSANIDVEGNLTLCCVLPDIFIGNVLEEDFHSVWNSKKMKTFRKMLLSGNYPKKCMDINCFGINPANPAK